jgi:hypothetical protein
MQVIILAILLSSCGGEGGTKSFSFEGILSIFHPKKIIDGFNLSVSDALGEDHSIKTINKIYANTDDAITDLRAKALKNKKSLWNPTLQKEYQSFLGDAKNHGIDIKDYSTSRLVGGQLVNKLEAQKHKNAVALCIRLNFKTGPNEKDKVYRIEVLEKKFYELQKKITTERKTKLHKHKKLVPSEILLKRILYHEFMHCVFHVSHLPNDLKYKNHIMYPRYDKNSVISLESWHQMVKNNFNPKYIASMPYVK